MLDKVRSGVLQLSTPSGYVCVRPALRDRLQLLWIFRNFKILPEQVLAPREKRLIDRLRGSDLAALPGDYGRDEGLVIGTVDYEFMKKAPKSERKAPVLVPSAPVLHTGQPRLAIVHRKEA